VGDRVVVRVHAVDAGGGDGAGPPVQAGGLDVEGEHGGQRRQAVREASPLGTSRRRMQARR